MEMRPRLPTEGLMEMRPRSPTKGLMEIREAYINTYSIRQHDLEKIVLSLSVFCKLEKALCAKNIT